MTRALLFLSLSIAAAPLHAVPSIGGVQNNYSFLLEGTPNHGIARGAIFILYGSEMSGGGLLLGGFNPKLDKNLGGVSISVTVNGVTTEAIPYYVSPGQIGAILPSATPAGQGTLTLTYAGETSAPYPILVVESAFGLMTMGGNGLGHAVVMDAGFTVLSPHNAPTAGQSVIFWGSGLGAFEGDETQLIAAPRSLEELPFELYIGGKLAETAYHGRSQFPALDQIVARIPDGVAGCFVSVYIKTGGFVSNFTTMPVAAPGAKQCEDVFTNTQEVLGLSGRETVVAGWLQLGRFIGHAQGMNGPTQVISDAATVQFLRYAPADFQNWGGLTLTSMGSCVLSTFVLSAPFQPPILEGLDGGELSITTPRGPTPLVRQGLGYNLAGTDVGTELPLFVGEPGETHTYSATGGPVVGMFSEPITLPPAFSVNGMADITTISRNQDFEITWTGGAPDGYVVVTGSSNDLTSAITQFNCAVPSSAGRITIPRDILASMIPSVIFPGPLFITSGQLLVYGYGAPERFTAPGLDIGNKLTYFAETATVAYE